MKILLLSAALLLCGEALTPELPAATNAPTGDLATTDVQPAARRRGRARRRAVRRVRRARRAQIVVDPVTGQLVRIVR